MAALAMGYWFLETEPNLESPKGCFAHFEDYIYWKKMLVYSYMQNILSFIGGLVT